MLRGANVDIGEGKWRFGASFGEFCDTVLTFISPFIDGLKKYRKTSLNRFKR